MGRILNRVDEIQGVIKPVAMYGICEGGSCNEGRLIYMAAVAVKHGEKVPFGMTSRTIPTQKYFQTSVPEQISTPDAYTAARNYATSLAYEIEEKDELELYEEVFQDPEVHRFRLYLPIK